MPPRKKVLVRRRVVEQSNDSSHSSTPSPPPLRRKSSKKQGRTATVPSGSSPRTTSAVPPLSSAPTEDLPLDNRFISPVAQEVYHKVIKNETLLPSMIFDYESLRNAGYDLEEVFRPLGISEFLAYRNLIYEDLVQQFYANMEEVKRSNEPGIVLRTRVCGHGFVLTEGYLCRVFNIPEGGIVPTGLSPLEETGQDSDDEDDEQLFLGEDFRLQKVIAYFKSKAVVEVGPFVDLEATDFGGDLRMIHYAVNRSITPKKDTQNHVTAKDIEILWHVTKGTQINFAALILDRMRYKWKQFFKKSYEKSQRKDGLPYGTIITGLLQAEGLDLSRYESQQIPHSWIYNKTNLGKSRMIKTENRGWIFGAHVRLDSDVLANPRDSFRIPPPIDRTLGGSRSGRTGTSGASSSRASVNVEEIRVLTAKVDKLAETQQKLVDSVEAIKGFVSDLWTWMKEARCTRNDAVPSTSTPPPPPAP